MKKIPREWVLLILSGLVLLVLLWSLPLARPPIILDLPYSQVKSLIADGEVESVTLRGRELSAVLKTPMPTAMEGQETTRVATFVPDFGDPDLIAVIEQSGAELITKRSPDDSGGNWLLALLPWIVIFGIYFWFWNRMQKNMVGRFGGRDIGDFLAGSARTETKDDRKVTFEDVAGQENAKREVAELIDFLRDPERFRRLGAEPPRGVLLMGPPGTGKTLLARALAGEAGVPFFYVSASEFIEMFVGVGASRVRKMFDEAKKRAPAIIFIDELDSVGRVRGTGLGGGNDEREQTLNQILAELDGFAGHEAVIVLAATNRPDVLDPALLRPGRFDRHVTLELPDKSARAAVLKVHTRRVPLADDVDLDAVAAGTPGFSGADLKNLVNEAAMAAAGQGLKAITMRLLEDMRDKIVLGSVRTLAIQPDEHHRLAVHEAGHTAVAYYLPEADPIHKVTIIPRGRALGGTHVLPEEERHTLPEDYLRARLAVLLAGRTAEKLFLGSVSSGADDDIKQATQLARAMVSRWGMAPSIGPQDLRQSDEHPFLGREIAQPRRFSETTAHRVDEAVGGLLREAEDRAKELIETHEDQVSQLIGALEQKETLDRPEILSLLSPESGGPQDPGARARPAEAEAT